MSGAANRGVLDGLDGLYGEDIVNGHDIFAMVAVGDEVEVEEEEEELEVLGEAADLDEIDEQVELEDLDNLALGGVGVLVEPTPVVVPAAVALLEDVEDEIEEIEASFQRSAIWNKEAFRHFCGVGNLLELEKLLRDFQYIEQYTGKSIHDYVDQDFNPVLIALDNDNIHVLNYLLDKGFAATICDQYGWSPLSVAIEKGSGHAVNLLLNAGVKISETCFRDYFPLNWAARSGAFEVVKMLIARGAEIDQKTLKIGSTPLMLAAQKGHLNIAKYLLENGASVNLGSTAHNASSLILAAEKGDLNMINLLLDMGAEIDQKTIDQISPLFAALSHEQYDAAILLLDRGADVNFVNSEGYSALLIAVMNNSLQVVNAILSKPGLDVKKPLIGEESILELLKKESFLRDFSVSQSIIEAVQAFSTPESLRFLWLGAAIRGSAILPKLEYCAKKEDSSLLTQMVTKKVRASSEEEVLGLAPAGGSRGSW